MRRRSTIAGSLPLAVAAFARTSGDIDNRIKHSSGASPYGLLAHATGAVQ